MKALTTKIIAEKHEHAFFTRTGGASTGDFASLNFSSKERDAVKNIETNLKLVCNHFQVDELQGIKRLHQVHSTKVILVEDRTQITSEIEADALVTILPNLVLSIITADCVPILLSDPVNGIVAAIHAGWKGAIAGIITQTIDVMIASGAVASNICAAIGPCIRQESYEVDQLFYKRLIEINPENAVYFKSAEAEYKFMFDLPWFCYTQLSKSGINKIDDIGINTYTEEKLFFSCRRSLHKGANFGCQMSAIMIKE